MDVQDAVEKLVDAKIKKALEPVMDLLITVVAGEKNKVKFMVMLLNQVIKKLNDRGIHIEELKLDADEFDLISKVEEIDDTEGTYTSIPEYIIDWYEEQSSMYLGDDDD